MDNTTAVGSGTAIHRLTQRVTELEVQLESAQEVIDNCLDHSALLTEFNESMSKSAERQAQDIANLSGWAAKVVRQLDDLRGAVIFALKEIKELRDGK